LHAYDELGVTWSHIPFGPHDDPNVVLADLYARIKEWLSEGERLLVHQEELGDRLMGVVGGYLRWSGLVPSGPQAIAVVEKILGRQMGPADPQRSRRRDTGSLNAPPAWRARLK
jgi:hypothetical protein